MATRNVPCLPAPPLARVAQVPSASDRRRRGHASLLVLRANTVNEVSPNSPLEKSSPKRTRRIPQSRDIALTVKVSAQTSVAKTVRAFQKALRDESQLRATLQRMQEEEIITTPQAAQIDTLLSEMTSTTSYILRHLGVHLGIGASKVILPLPIGSFLRGSWVVIARVSETAKRRVDHAGVHSLPGLPRRLHPVLRLSRLHRRPASPRSQSGTSLRESHQHAALRPHSRNSSR